MADIRKSLNEYLFYEFGVEGDASQVSDAWPFELREIGMVSGHPVFEFQEQQPYFAVGGPSLNFLPKAGMTLDDLALQDLGSRWIGARDPVDLSMSMPGDPAVPSGPDRRRCLESLGTSALPGRPVEILEGLFLRRENRYLGLFRPAGERDAFVAGIPESAPILVRFPEASSWRRLAWGVGTWLRPRAVREGAR